MVTIQIEDEQLARRLQQIAEQENRPLEDVLRTMVEQYPAPARSGDERTSEAVRQVRRKIYAMARRYWESVGDAAKAALTDEALDEQFGAFDEEGIPRLKSELKSLEPPVGSLAYAARLAKEAGLRSGKPDVARRSEEILREHFADELLARMKREDASK